MAASHWSTSDRAGVEEKEDVGLSVLKETTNTAPLQLGDISARVASTEASGAYGDELRRWAEGKFGNHLVFHFYLFSFFFIECVVCRGGDNRCDMDLV